MTITWEATLSTEFSKQEYWSVLPFPPPGDLLNPGIEPLSPELQADSSPEATMEVQEKKRSKRQRRKEKIHPTECRGPENSKER